MFKYDSMTKGGVSVNRITLLKYINMSTVWNTKHGKHFSIELGLHRLAIGISLRKYTQKEMDKAGIA